MAFPTTSLLDNFNRADQAPIAGNWSGPVRTTSSQNKLVTNTTANNNSPAGISQSYWNASTFGPDTEAYVTMSTVPAAGNGVNLLARLGSPNTANWDAYWLTARKQTGTDTWEMYRVDNNAFTQLGATVTGPEFASGDKFGIEATGSTINGYVFQSAAWTQTISRTDATYSAAGNIALAFDDTTAVADDFSGGTIVVTSTLHSLGLMGVGS